MNEDIQQAGEQLESFLHREEQTELKTTCEDQEEGARVFLKKFKQAVEEKEARNLARVTVERDVGRRKIAALCKTLEEIKRIASYHVQGQEDEDSTPHKIVLLAHNALAPKERT